MMKAAPTDKVRVTTYFRGLPWYIGKYKFVYYEGIRQYKEYTKSLLNLK